MKSTAIREMWARGTFWPWILFALLSGPAPPLAAQEALRLGELHIPPPRGYVNDFAGALSARERGDLEDLCRRIDRDTGAQIALAILPDLAGENATDVKTRLFKAWRVGRAQDDRGLLILHTLQERRVEVEVGYGLEGILPDGRVGAILDEAVMPHFRSGNFYDGYFAGLTAFGQRISGDSGGTRGQDAYHSGGSSAPRRGFPLKLLFLAPIFLYLLIRHPRLLLFMILMNMGGRRGGGMGGGFGGGFGGFGGGLSGGGGAGRSY